MFKEAYPVWAENTVVNQYVDFVQPFCMESVKSLTVYMRCHSHCILFINGHRVDGGQYPDYENYPVVDRLVVPAEFLCVGSNRLAVLAYAQNEDSSTYRCATPSLIFEVLDGKTVVAASGKETLCRTDPGYTSGPVELITGQLGFTFHYDSRRGDDWVLSACLTGFSAATVLPRLPRYYSRPIRPLADRGRCPATLIAAGSFRCEDRELPASQRIYTAYLRSLPMKPTLLDGGTVVLSATDGDGVYCVVDLGQERAGYPEWAFTVCEDCLVDIGYGEHLADLRVRTAVGGRNFAATYYAKTGENVFFHPFTRFAGRYLQVHFYTAKVEVAYIGLREKVYPVKLRPMPKGLTETEQRIYRVGVDTLRLCMHEHYEDCPWREQALYAMDGRNQMRCGYAAFGETRFAKASLRLLGLGLRDDGLLELCAPARVPVVIPSFSLVWIVSLREYVSQSGDVAFGRRWLKVARRILETFVARQEACGLVTPFPGAAYWNFYEWSPGLDGVDCYTHPDVLLNLFLAYALQGYGSLAESVGDTADEKWANTHYIALKKAINTHFWNEGRGAYSFFRDGTLFPELAQALSVVSGVAGRRRQRVVRGLVRNDFTPQATLSSSIFTFQAMLTQTETIPAVRQRIRNTWGKMLSAGATSFWETEKGEADFDRAGSLCHGWSAVPVYIYRYIEEIGG